MSKKSIGTGITRLLFGLKAKDLKVIPFNEMTPRQFEELDRFLGKVGFLLASDSYKLTTKQADYIVNQIKQLDLYRERMMPGTKPDFKDFIPRDNLGIPAADKAREFKGFDPKVIQGGKPKIIQPKNAKQDVIDANENLAGGANYAKGDTKYNALSLSCSNFFILFFLSISNNSSKVSSPRNLTPPKPSDILS